MPTLRLGDSERSQIIGAFAKVANQAANNQVFPLIKDDFPEFGYELLEPDIAEAYKLLRERATELTKVSSWCAAFVVSGNEYSYHIEVRDVPVPTNGLAVPHTHHKYDELLDWAEKNTNIKYRVRDSMNFLRGAVNQCSSAGQVKRVLSEDIIRFVPNYMQSTFADAERRSRLPTNLCMDGFADKLTELADVLALGSLSPEKLTGLEATVSVRTSI